MIKSVIVKGTVPVDENFDKGPNFHVLVHKDVVYAATLNQTNIQKNNNKYYIIQIIQSDSNPNQNYFFTRWGRVGKVANFSNEGPYGIDQAIMFYKNKHKDKTKKGDYVEI